MSLVRLAEAPAWHDRQVEVHDMATRLGALLGALALALPAAALAHDLWAGVVTCGRLLA